MRPHSFWLFGLCAFCAWQGGADVSFSNPWHMAGLIFGVLGVAVSIGGKR